MDLSIALHAHITFAEYFEPAVQAAFERAQARRWRVLARRFAHHPAVFGYDLIDEPMGRLRAGEGLPAAAHRIESEQLTPMYDRIAGAIRRVDRHHRLFVEPTPIVGEGLSTPPADAGWQVSVHGPATARPRAVPAGERGTIRVGTQSGACGRVTVSRLPRD